MKEKLRKTGTGFIGNVPWGTHFCQFYQTREDLADILIPYFEAGLENNEYCMWVTSRPLDETEAKNAMERAVPHFDRYLKKGQIEIIPYTEWYLKGGALNQKKVLDSWIDKLNQALAKGYDGMRVTGNTAWLEKRDWKKFTDYEEEINNTIGEYRMLVNCTYWLDKCGAAEIIDVVSNHQFALIRQEGKWKSIESSERKQAKDEIAKSEQKYRSLIERTGAGVAILDLKGKFTYVNDSLCKMIGYSKDELIGKAFTDFLHPGDKKKMMQIFLNAFKNPRQRVELDFKAIHKKGHKVYMNSIPTGYIHNGKVLGFTAIITDTTVRKKAEEALIESEDQYKNIFELAPDGIFTINKKGIITACNPTFFKLSGFSKNDIVGKHFSKAPTLYKKEVPKYIKLFISIINGKTPKPFEISWKHKNGRSRLAEVLVSLRRKNLEIVGLQGIVRDITERKKTEYALRESEEKYRNLVEKSQDSIVITDLKGNVQFANKASEKLLGFKIKEEIGMNIGDMTSPKYWPKSLAALMKVKSGKKVPYFESMIKRKDGRLAPVESGVQAIFKDGKPVCIQIITRDITERKQAEQMQRLQSEITSNMAEGVYLIRTSDMVIVYTNPKFAEMFGYGPDEMIGQHVSIVNAPTDLTPKETVKAIMSEIEKGNGYWNGEVKNIKKDGTPFWCHASVSVFDHPEYGEVLVSVHTEITERKQAEEELEKSQAKLRNLAVHLQSRREKELSKIAGDIHDDLAQSLTALKMDMVFLSRKMPEGQKDLSDRLKSMIDLSDVTIQTARSLCAELRPSVLDDLGLAEAVRWYAKDYSKRVGIRCDISIVPENFPAEEERSTAVFRIFQEILTNVALHAEATMVKVELKAASGNLELEVKDNGKGITQKQLTDSKSFGLIGIRERVKAFGGEAWIRGVAGKGTAVKVTIPLLVQN